MNKYLMGLLATALLMTGYSASLQAAGSLLVTPTRIVFEQRDRSAQVTLVNQSDQTSNFRISFIRQNMTEDGEFLPVPEGQEGLFSDSMIRYSPRQITLPPGQSQVIRLALRRPADLTDGEYRSHMLFQALPDPESSNVEKITQQTSDGITIELLPIIGVSIPVIVRQGELSSEVSLSDASLEAAEQSGASPMIAVNINRRGNGSAYGDLRATFTPEGGSPIVIAQANKIAVYANMPTRRFQLPLNLAGDVNLQNGAINLLFLESGADDEASALARTRILLN